MTARGYRLLVGVLGSLLVAVVGQLGAQTTTTATLAGRVMSADSNQPLAGASVRLTRVDGVGAKVTIPPVATGEKGEFSFTNLAPGRYWITAAKPRYLTLAYGQRPRSGLPGISVVLTPGGRAPELTIALPLASVITGTVLDEHGEPAMGANVAARIVEWRNGERAARDLAFDIVDDRGIYRITNLPPGSYIVTAFRGAATPDPVPLIFYPGTAAPSQATAIPVGVSDERAGMNLAFPADSGLAGLSGRLVSSGGQPVATTRISVVADGPVLRGLDVRQIFSSRTGEFRLGHLAPGGYRLIAATSDGELTAVHDIVLATTPADPIELTMRPGAVVSGLVTGLPEGATGGPRVSLAALGESGRPAATLSGRADVQGRFALRGVVPGRYVVVLSDLTTGYRVASLEQDGRDIHDLPITVGESRELEGIKAMLAPASTTLVGTLLDRAGLPTPDFLVVVFAEDERYWWPGTPRIRAEQPSSDGRYRFAGLPPGRYRIAVVTDAEPGEWLAPEFLKKLMPASVRLTLEAGKTVSQDLRMK